jgi:hypothetical protein
MEEDAPLQMALGTEFGLFFVNLKGAEMTIASEVHFKGQQISQVVQLSPGFLLVGVFNQNTLFIVDRQNKKNQIKIEHPHGSLLNCSDIM